MTRPVCYNTHTFYFDSLESDINGTRLVPRIPVLWDRAWYLPI
ncbi:MAG: hypothetical protein JWO04_1198 [Gammaproteobacteria bacterium]|jgi:hypothetical protein|nr:hypothetical protein [Gammaproteobacteria bacterium]